MDGLETFQVMRLFAMYDHIAARLRVSINRYVPNNFFLILLFYFSYFKIHAFYNGVLLNSQY